MGWGRFAATADAVSTSTAKTTLQGTAPATAVGVLKRIRISQSTSTSNSTNLVKVLRKTAAGSGTSLTAAPQATGQGASGFTWVYDLSSEGTDGTTLLEFAFNALVGWEWTATPEDKLVVPPSGIVAIKFAAPPVNASWSTTIEYEEIG